MRIKKTGGEWRGRLEQCVTAALECIFDERDRAQQSVEQVYYSSIYILAVTVMPLQQNAMQ